MFFSWPNKMTGRARISAAFAVAAEKELPFTLRVPNAETLAAMNEADEITKTRRARFSSAEELLASLKKDCA